MIQRSRKPAAAILLATVVAGVVYVHSTGAASSPADGPALAELEVAIANPDAPLETWLTYAQRLQQAGRFAHAAAAYQRVLETDPFCRVANFQCAVVLAKAGDPDAFYSFMANLLLSEPRLALEIFGRPEIQRYMGEERFQSLLAQARVQSMD
jgi:hypothetical protein